MKNKLLIIVYIQIICILVGLYYNYEFNNVNSHETIINPIHENLAVDSFIDIDPEVIFEYKRLTILSKKNKEINSDYIGELFFESSLINVSIVQGESNNTYLRKNWSNGKYDVGGSVFIDYRNEIEDDQNIIFYGHNYSTGLDFTHKKAFSPLRYLNKKENYEDNKYIYFFADGILKKYEIVSVFRVKIISLNNSQYIADGQPIYVYQNYTVDDFYDFISKVKENEYYDTGAVLSYKDRFITLQTCIENSIDKLVIIAKEINHVDVADILSKLH